MKNTATSFCSEELSLEASESELCTIQNSNENVFYCKQDAELQFQFECERAEFKRIEMFKT